MFTQLVNQPRRHFVIGVFASTVTSSYMAQGRIPTLPSPGFAGSVATPEQFGAAGDGKTDDTAALQRAFLCGATTVMARVGATYLVSMAGTKSIHGVEYRYCLRIPSKVTIDFQNATLRLAPLQNAALLINDGAGQLIDREIQIKNCILDGNKMAQSLPSSGEMACVFLWGVTGARISRISARNVRQYAGRFLACTNGQFEDLDCADSDGDGWSFGIAARDQVIRSSRIDRVRATGCTNLAIGTLQGNPAILCVHDCAVGSITGVNCGGGIKIQDGSRNSSFELLRFIGGPKSTANSGIKVQGRNGFVVSGLRIRNVEVDGAGTGTGLYTYACHDISIDSYVGTNGGKEGAAPDCDLRGNSVSIRRLVSKRAPHVAVLIGSDGIVETDISIGDATIVEMAGNAIQVSMNGGFAHIDRASIVTGARKDWNARALSVTGRDTSGGCARLTLPNDCHGSRPPLYISPNCPAFTVKSAAFCGDPLQGIVHFASGQTLATVVNRSAYRLSLNILGSQLFPAITVTSESGSAENDRFTVRIRDVDEGSGFDIRRTGPLEAVTVSYRIGAWSVVAMSSTHTPSTAFNSQTPS